MRFGEYPERHIVVIESVEVCEVKGIKRVFLQGSYSIYTYVFGGRGNQKLGEFLDSQENFKIDLETDGKDILSFRSYEHKITEREVKYILIELEYIEEEEEDGFEWIFKL